MVTVKRYHDDLWISLSQSKSTFRGRHWLAWYSDLPISEGPWKFCGLPGMILRIEDSNHEHLFTAISIRNIKSNITRKNSQTQKRQGKNLIKP